MLAGLAAGAGTVLAGGGAPAAQRAAPGDAASEIAHFKAVLPELWDVTAPPQHSAHLVIGSGFGGAITALRLAKAGESVTVLERGFKWPTSPWRDTFSNDQVPDGRAFWYRTSAKMIAGDTTTFNSFGGIVDVSEFPNMTAWHGACVGGGSMVFTGCMIEPEQKYFEAIFGSNVTYDEMHRIYYPRVRKMLNLRTIPLDLYWSSPFGHSREWDREVSAAGYTPTPSDSIFNWDVVRAENWGLSRASATVGLSNHGNSNGAKFDLNQNYLKYAQASGRAKVHPGFEVLNIARQGNGYAVHGFLRTPDNHVLKVMTLTCDRLYLAAGSIGTTNLLVKAQALGDLPDLNAAVGQGWGSNGDTIVVRSGGWVTGLTEGTPSASRIHEPTLGGLPLTLENWYVPGLPINIGVIPSLGMAFDQTNRGSFTYDPKSGRAELAWAAGGNDDAVAASRIVNNKICDASNTTPGIEPFMPDVGARNWTAHPLGGVVIGEATDSYGRVDGYQGLYVMDGALIPGTTGAVNPSLTISALAERNIEAIIKNGG
jgi:cholesterol oxidase